MTVLLYTDEVTVDAVRESLENATVIDQDFVDHSMLKNLDKKFNETHHSILVTSWDDAMRGFDYRAKTFGVCLIVDRGFCSPEDVDQGLARVGRQNDPCDRLITNTTEKVDKEKYNAIIDTMKRFVFGRQQMRNKYSVKVVEDVKPK